MIEDLLTSYIFEKLDKQIVNKVPYCLFFALLIYYFFNFQNIALFLAPISFIVFIVSSIYFNSEVSELATKMWTNIDVKDVLRRMTNIYEKGDSFLKDLKLSKTPRIGITGFIAGLALTITLTTVFLLLLYYIPLGTKQIIIPVTVIVAIFLLYDVAKAELIEEPKEENNNLTLANDVMSKYLVENSQGSSNSNVSQMLFTFVTRVISPLIYFSFPKMTYKETFVYSNPKLREYIKQISRGDGDLQLKRTDGFSLDALLVTDENCDKLSDIAEKQHSIVFPYLLNPDYKFSDYSNKKETPIKKWTALQVIRKQSTKGQTISEASTSEPTTNKNSKNREPKKKIIEEPVGQVFIHAFRIPRVKVDRGHGRPKEVEHQRDVLMIMMMGERSSIQYIFTKISTMSLPCPVQKVIDEMLEN